MNLPHGSTSNGRPAPDSVRSRASCRPCPARNRFLASANHLLYTRYPAPDQQNPPRRTWNGRQPGSNAPSPPVIPAGTADLRGYRTIVRGSAGPAGSGRAARTGSPHRSRRPRTAGVHGRRALLRGEDRGVPRQLRRVHQRPGREFRELLHHRLSHFPLGRPRTSQKPGDQDRPDVPHGQAPPIDRVRHPNGAVDNRRGADVKGSRPLCGAGVAAHASPSRVGTFSRRCSISWIVSPR